LRDTIKKPPPSVSMQGHAGRLVQQLNMARRWWQLQISSSRRCSA
jgi:hypothetical protein